MGETVSSDGSIGSVVGQASSWTTTTPVNIKHCYWTNDDYEGACGDGSPVVDSDTSFVALGTATVVNLNNYNISWNK